MYKIFYIYNKLSFSEFISIGGNFIFGSGNVLKFWVNEFSFFLNGSELK